VNSVLFFIVTCFWSVMVILFDGSMGNQLLQQFESRHYPFETGQITHSQVTRHRGSKGRTSYGVDVRFRYVVNNIVFYGRRFRYNAGSTDAGRAWKIVSLHPVGSQTPVFYNPRNPQDAVLSPGLEGSDVLFVLFYALQHGHACVLDLARRLVARTYFQAYRRGSED
jgi:hypothetical protein